MTSARDSPRISPRRFASCQLICGRRRLLRPYSFLGVAHENGDSSDRARGGSSLTGIAHATPLVVTDGKVTFYFLDTSAFFSGDGFSAFAGYTTPLFSGTVSSTVPIGFRFSCVPGAPCVEFAGPFFAQVDGEEPCSRFNLAVSHTCGAITVKSDFLPAPGFTAPFTATGLLNVGAGFDLV